MVAVELVNIGLSQGFVAVPWSYRDEEIKVCLEQFVAAIAYALLSILK